MKIFRRNKPADKPAEPADTAPPDGAQGELAQADPTPAPRRPWPLRHKRITALLALLAVGAAAALALRRFLPARAEAEQPRTQAETALETAQTQLENAQTQLEAAYDNYDTEKNSTTLTTSYQNVEDAGGSRLHLGGADHPAGNEGKRQKICPSAAAGGLLFCGRVWYTVGWK